MDNGIEFKKFCFKMKWERRLEKTFSKFPQEIREQYAPEFNHYLTSNDHGLPHAANVYGKVLEILERFSEVERREIDVECLEAMCIFHDAGRFFVPVESAPNYAKRKRKGRFHHEYAGALLAKIFGYNHSIIREGILHHDFFGADLDKCTKPPVSLEAQIFRAADKTSIAPAAEIERYNEYWIDYNATHNEKIPLFDHNPFEFYVNWNFSKKEERGTDELCYFLAVLTMRPEDFRHPTLQEHYRNWSRQKEAAIKRIVEIVRKEQGDADADIVDCMVIAYLKAHGILF